MLGFPGSMLGFPGSMLGFPGSMLGFPVWTRLAGERKLHISFAPRRRTQHEKRPVRTPWRFFGALPPLRTRFGPPLIPPRNPFSDAQLAPKVSAGEIEAMLAQFDEPGNPAAEYESSCAVVDHLLKTLKGTNP